MIKKKIALTLAMLFFITMSGSNTYASMPEKPVKTIAKTPIKKIVVKPVSRLLSPMELKTTLKAAGFKGHDLIEAWGVAMKESKGHPFAHNTNSHTGDNSYGLFQINMIGSLGPARRDFYNLKTNNELFNPLTNAKIAYQISNGGRDWSAWH